MIDLARDLENEKYRDLRQQPSMTLYSVFEEISWRDRDSNSVAQKCLTTKATTVPKHLDVVRTIMNMYNIFHVPTRAKPEILDEVLSFDVDESAN